MKQLRMGRLLLALGVAAVQVACRQPTPPANNAVITSTPDAGANAVNAGRDLALAPTNDATNQLATNQAAAEPPGAADARATLDRMTGGIALPLFYAKLAVDGFAGAGQLTCIPGKSAGVAYECTQSLTEPSRPSATGKLQFLIYDQPLNFDGVDAAVRKSVSSQGGGVVVDNSWTWTTESVDPGGPQRKTPVRCHQSRGQPNGYVACLSLLTPTVLLATRTDPLAASDATPEDGSADAARAAKLTDAGTFLVQPPGS